MFLRFARIAPSVLRPRSTLASPFVRADSRATPSAPRQLNSAPTEFPSAAARVAVDARSSARSRAASTRARGVLASLDTHCSTGTIPLGCTLRSTASSPASTIAVRSSSSAVAHRALAIARRRVGSARRDRARRDAVDARARRRDGRRATPSADSIDARHSTSTRARRARGDGRRRDRGTDRGGRVRTRDVRADDGGCATRRARDG